MAEHVRRTGAKRSNLVVGAVVEWLRMKAHQGIVFVTAEEIDGLISRHHASQDKALAAWTRLQMGDAL